MSTTTSLNTREGSVSEVEIFRHSARTIQKVVTLNVDGLTQADSLIQPRPTSRRYREATATAFADCAIAAAAPGFDPRMAFGR